MQVDAEYSETVQQLKEKLSEESKKNERLKQQVLSSNEELKEREKELMVIKRSGSPKKSNSGSPLARAPVVRKPKDSGSKENSTDPAEASTESTEELKRQLQETKASHLEAQAQFLKELEEMKSDRVTLVERAKTVGQDAAANLRLSAELRREKESLQAELAAEKANSERVIELHKKCNKELELANTKLLTSANERNAMKKELQNAQRNSADLENQVGKRPVAVCIQFICSACKMSSYLTL